MPGSLKDAVVDLLDKVARPPGTPVPEGATAEQIRQFETSSGMILPQELHTWLEVCNGGLIGPGGVYGVHPALDILNIDLHLDLNPEWRDRQWAPIAGDGNGNTYVLDTRNTPDGLRPVYFIDHEGNVADAVYLVASDLWHFLYFLLAGDIEQEQTKKCSWPFNSEYVLRLDPILGQIKRDVPLPWNATYHKPNGKTPPA